MASEHLEHKLALLPDKMKIMSPIFVSSRTFAGTRDGSGR